MGDGKGGAIKYQMINNMPNSLQNDNIMEQVGSPTNNAYHYRGLMAMNLSHGDVSENELDSDEDELTLNTYEEPTMGVNCWNNSD